MATLAKTFVATGCSSGLGFELVKQLLAQSQPYRFILGARDTKNVEAAYNALKYDSAKHSLSILPLDLSELKGVKSFAQQTLEKLGKDKVDCLLLNAGMVKSGDGPGPHGSKWSEQYVVNHLCKWDSICKYLQYLQDPWLTWSIAQHYLIHLLKEKLIESRSRIVFISSGAIRQVNDTSKSSFTSSPFACPPASHGSAALTCYIGKLDSHVLAGGSRNDFELYGETKFIQLLNAQYWRRQLWGSCVVVAVSPGLIPGTGLARHSNMKIPANLPDAKSVPEGAQNMLRAVEITDFPEDPDQIFLTSWGEWWGTDVYPLALDKALQDKWSASKEDIESQEGL